MNTPPYDNPADAVNRIAARTWDSRAKNIIQLLTDTGYKFTHVRTAADELQLIFPNDTGGEQAITLDLSSEPSHRELVAAVEAYLNG